MKSQEPKIKSALSSYMFFLKEQRQMAANMYPNGQLLMKEMVRQLANSWQNLSEDDKKPYRMMGDADRLRVELEQK